MISLVYLVIKYSYIEKSNQNKLLITVLQSKFKVEELNEMD